MRSLDGVALDRLRRKRWLGPAALSLGWLALGGVAALGEALASGSLLRWPPAALSPLLASVIWIPLTFAAAALARRVPWERGRAASFLGVHLPAAVATSFLLNGAFFSAGALMGTVGPAGILPAALEGGARWLHLNGVGYLAVVAAIHLLDGRVGPWGAEGDRKTGEAAAHGRVLRVSSAGSRLQLPLSEIEWIEADGDYVRVHTGDRSYLLSARMKGLEEELTGSSLVRVHRSAIVNLDRVRELRHLSHGDYEAVLAAGTVVRVSRTRRAELLERLE